MAITDSKPLRNLGGAIAAVAIQGGGGQAASGLHDAAADLRTLSGQVTGSARASFVDVADAFDRLSEKGIGDKAAADDASEALDRLGKEVQQLCNFPLG